MGEVYKALDTRLERTVAIKVLPEHIANREELRKRFEREARACDGKVRMSYLSKVEMSPR